MSQVPNSSPLLLATPIPGPAGRRGHGHRRSAAISGDFDAMGLGLFSPPGTAAGSGNTPSKKPSLPDFDIDKHFNFNNDEDFTEGNKNMDFSFPNASTTPRTSTSANFLHSASVPSPRNSAGFTSPPKRLLHHHSFNSLNSPIRLGRKAQSFHMPPKTRFFLTEETQLNNENGVPDPVIDLDEVLSANLHIGDQGGSNNSSNTYLPQPQPVTSHTHGRSQSYGHTSSKDNSFASPMVVAPFEMYPDENDCTLLSSPCFKLYPSPFISSPLSTSNNPLFQQPIQEMDQFTDELEEVMEIELPKEEEGEACRLPTSASVSDLEQDTFPNPQSALVGLYSNDSANSSCSSLRSSNTTRNVSNPLIEKTFSNDSTNNYSNLNINTPPSSHSNHHGKRSGAKATRYQSFYDQSYKISNALKISSTESVNIVRTTSNDSGGSGIFPKEIKILGHSSSLPSLKTVLNKRSNQKLRFNEVRVTSGGFAGNGVTTANASVRKLSPPVQVNTKESMNSIHATPKTIIGSSTILVVPPMNSGSKNVSNSPISINSEVSSTIISSNATIQSTEHSSLHEQQTNSFASKDSEQHTITDVTPTPLIVVSNEDDMRKKPSPISIPDKTTSMDSTLKKSIIVLTDNTSPNKKTNPTSAISPISASFPLNSNNSVSNSKEESRTSSPSNTVSSRRPLSPQEKSFLKQTQIPSFRSPTKSKKDTSSSPSTSAASTSTNKQDGTTVESSKSSLFSLLQNRSVPPLQQPALSNNRLQNLNHTFAHRKSHSVTLSTGQENENDDLRSLRLNTGKRNSRFINWLKRKY